MASPMKLKKQAFTLIELLIVVAIIAILAAIAVPNFLEAQVRAKVSRARTDLRSIATALESYAVDNNKYPPMMGIVYSPLNPNNGYGSARVSAWRGVPSYVTTPIAYVTSIFPDVFKQNTNAHNEYGSDPDEGKAYQNGNPFDISPIYQNIQQLRVNPGPPTYQDADINDYGSWRLMSVGPDHTYNRIGTDSLQALGWIYDPTNGTVSQGMVIRTANQTQVAISH